MTAAWVAQTIEQRPRIFSAVTVGGNAYLLGGLKHETTNDSTIIEIQPDGTTIEYEYTLGAGMTALSVAVAGTKIVFTEPTSATTAYVGVFNTVTKAFTRYSAATSPSVSFPRWSGGALGPDGLVYFAPARADGSWVNMRVLVYNPTTNAVTFTNFGGTWTAVNSAYAGAIMGGDGYMYFMPGYRTVAGGTVFSGHAIRVLDFGTMTVSELPLVDDDSFGGEYTSWVQPCADGVIAGYASERTYKTTHLGSTFIATADIYDDDLYVDNGELTEAPSSHGSTIGSDGKIYAIGYQYRSSLHYSPCLTIFDPADESLHFQEYPSMDEYPFTPGSLYAVGDIVGAFDYWGTGNPNFPPKFESSLYVPPSAPVSYAWGATPVSLALGWTPVEAWVGAGSPT